MRLAVEQLGRRAFTIVEMIIVIAVIVLILAIGVPAFNSMTIQQRMSKTRQLLNGTLTRTNVISISDRTLAAVRIFPAEWHLDESDVPRTTSGRQIITTYSYRATSAANPTNPSAVVFAERFEPIQNGPTQLLPPDTWVAPSEALLDDALGDPFEGDEVLNGLMGADRFALDATGSSSGDYNTDFLSADDFLIVFDPETGVVMQRPYRFAATSGWTSWRLLGYDPEERIEWDGVRNNNGVLTVPFQRYNFAGAVVYQREAFQSLGSDAEPDARRELLKRSGMTFYVSRAGGTLVAGSGETTQGD